MEYSHRFNIIHRDLKPENILLDLKKHVKICDFGIATIIDIDTQRRTQTRTHGIGTLAYMAPELYDENKPYNEKVDVYAYGIILYFILSGGNYPNINIADIINAKEITVPDTINDLSKDLIKKCTSYDYHSRPSFNEIVQIIRENDFKLINNLSEQNIEEIKNHLNYNE